MTFSTAVPRCRTLGCILLIALLLPACSRLGGDKETPDTDGVSATASPPDLVIANHTSEDVYTFVIGRQAAARVNWAVGVRGRGLPSGQSKRIPYDDIFTFDGEKEVLVYWWQAILKDGERVPGEVHSIVLAI